MVFWIVDFVDQAEASPKQGLNKNFNFLPGLLCNCYTNFWIMLSSFEGETIYLWQKHFAFARNRVLILFYTQKCKGKYTI